MADLSTIQATVPSIIVGSDATGLEQTPVQSTANGALHTNLRNASGTEIGTTTNPISVQDPLDIASTMGNISTQDISSATTTGFGGQSTIIGTPTANSAVSQVINSIQTVMVLIKGTFTGTLAVEVSSDAALTWVPRSIHVVGTAIFSAAITAPVVGSLNASAKTNVRVRATTAITGGATVQFLVSDNPSNMYVANAIKLVDGSSSTSTTQMTIKPASTAALATDPAMVMALSPNTPLPTGTNSLGSIVNVSGTVSLPTGAATSANQATEIASLSSIDAKLTTTNSSLAAIDAGTPVALGQTTMSASQPVTIASDQSIISVTDFSNGGGTQAALTVGTSAVLVSVSGTNLTNRKFLTLMNNSVVILYWGYTNAVTTSTGTPLFPGQEMGRAVGPATNVYVIAGTASNNARVTERA